MKKQSVIKQHSLYYYYFCQMSPIHQKKRITLMRLRFILRYLNAASM